ncbi:MAG: small protein [Microbacterium sp.]|nr:small protein [Microbacterium sp.]
MVQSAGRAVLRAARAVHWYVTSLMGDNAYATYLAHQRRTTRTATRVRAAADRVTMEG